MSLAWYLILAGVLFAIGATTVLVRRSAVIALMGVEMMLNAANLVLVTFSRINSNVDGEIMAFVRHGRRGRRSCRRPVDLVSIYRSRSTTSMDDLNLLKN